MNNQIKSNKSVYLTLGAGFALGAACVGFGMMKGASMAGEAYGQSKSFQARSITAPSGESLAEMRNLDAFYSNLAAFVQPAVVDIQATSGRRAGPNGERMPVSGGEGSGFILRPDGYIVTNDHVVGGFDNVKVILKDGREFDGKVTRAHDSDIAIIKIDAKNLPTLQFGDSNKLKVGQMAMAVGAPFGLAQSVTYGHISALGRDKTFIENRYYPDMIQTDTAINMGNSGGPLVNMDGQVVGLNTAIYSPSGTSAGIGFAIPSDQVRLIADKLIETGKIVRAQIGISPENLTDYQKETLHLTGGAKVMDAPEGQPAGMAGIKKDDVIVKIGSTPVNNQLDLRNSMLQYAPNTTVPVEYVRGGQHKTVQVKLGTKKELSEEEMQQMQGGNGRQAPQFRFPKGNGGGVFDDPEQFFKNFPGFGNGDNAPRQKSAPKSTDGKAHLGATVGPVNSDTQQQFSLPSGSKGAVVADVVSGSIAEQIGLKPGDLITSFNGKSISNADELVSAIKALKAGDHAEITYKRYSAGSSSSVTTQVTF